MSWPTDGEPRFVVREHSGYRMGRMDRTGPPGRVAGTSVRVVDRAYNHRTVVEWATEDFNSSVGRIEHKRRLLRERAALTAARLNALAVARS